MRATRAPHRAVIPSEFISYALVRRGTRTYIYIYKRTILLVDLDSADPKTGSWSSEYLPDRGYKNNPLPFDPEVGKQT